jgi:phosphoribosylformylglycinamidine synthase
MHLLRILTSVFGILTNIEKKYVESCHDVSEGGIGVCLSEMSIGGDIGAIVDISKINHNLRDDYILFSESNSRWILEVKKQYEKEFETILNKQNTPFIKLGTTCGDQLLINKGNSNLISLDIETVRDIWKNAIWNLMG